jgi:choline kinase
MSYRVCIPCAGTGSRLGSLTRFINKALVSIANRPTLSHLIEQFPSDVEFVIALGHKGDLIREFLTLAYPTRQFYFSEVLPFQGPGSGLGLSLQACRQHLQQPFVFVSCDTLVDEPIPAPDENWMAYAEVTCIDSYRTISLSTNVVSVICEKGEGLAPIHKAYIGLAGIHDYEKFWTAMAQGGEIAIQNGEAHGLRNLLPNTIKAYRFTWHDTGNPEALSQARQHYHELNGPNILDKANEAIWFVGGEVIKFSDDQRFIANRVKRVEQLRGFVPEVTGAELHMYRYSEVQGQILSEVVTLPLFDRLLEHCTQFWQKKVLSPAETIAFKETCMSFYRDKTFERVALFYKNYNRKDGLQSINGEEMESLDGLLNSLDWQWLAKGLPGRFHGDFHFENILWVDSDERFIFLDWRQDFGGNLSTGDVYYDFAKLLHGLIISHEIITKDFYHIEWRDEKINFDFHRKQILVECERYFGTWLESHGYDSKKVRILTALIYLNIAALHHHPYGLLLYALGKSMLKSEMEN